MNAVGRLGSYISRGVYTVSAPFHPFGGAVDIIVVEQEDGTFKSSPWYVKFGKFQGVLKTREKLITVCVNGEEAGFNMFLDHKGEAYFLREVDHDDDDDGVPSAPSSGEDTTEDCNRRKKIGGVASVDSGVPLSGSFDENAVRTMASNGKMIVRTRSRSAAILGFMFGRRSMKRERKDGNGVDRSESLERVEMVADLLETKWSTNVSDMGKEGRTKSSSRLGGSRVHHADLGGDQTADENCGNGDPKVESSPGEHPSLDTNECIDIDSLKLQTSEPEDASSILENCDISVTVLENSCQEISSFVPEADSMLGNNAIQSEVSGLGNLGSRQKSESELSIGTDQRELGNDASFSVNSNEERELKNDNPSSSGLICHEGVTVCTPKCNDKVTKQGVSEGSYRERMELHTLVLSETSELSAELSHELTLSDLPVDIEEENLQCGNSNPNDVNHPCHILETHVAMEKENNLIDSALDAFSDLVDGGNEHLVEDSTLPENLEMFQMDDVLENENIEISPREEVETGNRGTCLESLNSKENKVVVIDKRCSFPDSSETVEVRCAEKICERFSTGGSSLSYNADIEINHQILDPEATSMVTTLSCHKHSEACNNAENHISMSSPSKHSAGKPIAVKSDQMNSYDSCDENLLTSVTHVSDDNLNFQVSVHETAVVQDERMALDTIGVTQQSTGFDAIHEHPLISASELTNNKFQSSSLADSTVENYTLELQNVTNYRMYLEDGKRSEAIKITNVRKYEADELLPKSLPIIRSGISDLESLELHTLSHSLTSNYELLKTGMIQMDFRSPPELMKDSKSGLEQEQGMTVGSGSVSETQVAMENARVTNGPAIEISLCKHLLSEGMGVDAASKAFDAEKISFENFSTLGPSVVTNDKLIVRINGQYFPWEAAAPIVLGMVSFGEGSTSELKGMISVEPIQKALEKYPSDAIVPASGSWRFWPFGFQKSRTHVTSRSLPSTLDEAGSQSFEDKLSSGEESMRSVPKKFRTIIPTPEQLASLNLKEGRNVITFTFSTAMLGKQQVDARIYLWKWNTRIVISDVDGTITKSDVLGQFMPLVGKDWSHLGVAHLYSAIKENGYQMLFLSARAISQAYLTRQFLFNLKQDGKALPDGPVVISPDGLFPSLFREVIRRAPHEFKISCLEDIRALFPSDGNPFYAGFGNRDTDEISYLKVGIPKGKIFIINPKGEVAVNRRIDTKSYHSLHSLVNDIFPAMSSHEPEDFNSWNYWKMPLPDVTD